MTKQFSPSFRTNVHAIDMQEQNSITEKMEFSALLMD